MTIKQTQDWIVITHDVFGENEEGQTVKLEHNERRGYNTLEEATAFANQQLAERNIQEEIIYEDVPLPDWESTPTQE